jgi:hypothetical protein
LLLLSAGGGEPVGSKIREAVAKAMTSADIEGMTSLLHPSART